MNKILLVVIATGKYDRFVADVFHSALMNFLPHEKRGFLLLSDYGSPTGGIPQAMTGTQMLHYNIKFEIPRAGVDLYHYHIPHLPWPYPTLNRYQNIIDVLNGSVFIEEYTHIFYVDADALFIHEISNCILLSDIVAAQHCGFADGGWGSPNNPLKSCSWITHSMRKVYVMGGFQGGKTYAYLSAALQINNEIMFDEKLGIMAEWHDETHWNKFVNLRLCDGELSAPEKTLILPPTFMMGEKQPDANKKAKILALDKNHAALRA